MTQRDPIAEAARLRAIHTPPPDPPIAGYWSVSGDVFPEDMKGIGDLLKEAHANGQEVVVREGITLTWRPLR